MKAYISGKMSGVENFNREAFYHAEEVISKHGHEVFNPARIRFDRPDNEVTWFDWMREALHGLIDADFVVLLPGWETSKGVSIEVRLAKSLGIMVREFSDYEDANMFHRLSGINLEPRPVPRHITLEEALSE